MNFITQRNQILIIGFLGLFLSSVLIQNVFAIPAIYQRCEPDLDCIIGEFIFEDDRSTPVTTDNFCQITITDPTESVIVSDVNMPDSDDGWYYYSVNYASPEGLYRTKVCCDTGADKRCMDKTFILGTSFETLPGKIWTYASRTLTSFGTLVADVTTAVWGAGEKTLTSFGTLASDVWSNATRTLTGGALEGGEELATVSSISSAVTELRGSDGDMDLTTLAGYVDSVEGYIGLPADTGTSTLFGAVKDVRTKLDQLDDLETKIDTVDTVIDLLRASQSLGYTVNLSDVGEILETKDYRVKLTILNYESQPVDASSVPTIILYDALRSTAVDGTMTKLSDGVYELVYTVPSGAANGTWETAVSVDLGGALPIKVNDYWEVEGSPAQVVINSVYDTSLFIVSADVTISNEGSVGYEYQYEYCVVAEESNQCGGGDDAAYALAAKYLNAGQDWNTDLSLSLSDTGNYYFKVVVYWGTETSGAARAFTAIEEGGPAGGGHTAMNFNDIYSKLLEIQEELGYHGKSTTDIGVSAFQTLKVLSTSLKNIGGTKGYNLDYLYDVSSIDSTDLFYLKNKSIEIKALLEVNQMLIDKAASQPIIKTWLEWGSVILKMLVVNPSASQSQIVPFKAYLPREVKPEYIIDQGDLSLNYDEEAGLWYVYKDIRLAPGQSITKKVEIKDIWEIPQEEIDSLRKQFEDLIKPLEKTAFFAQAITLKSDSERLLDGVVRKQNEYKATPQEHIITSRDNQESLKAARLNLEALKMLVAEESGAGRAMGGLFGVSTTMTWAIIIIVIVGIAVLMILLYSLLAKRKVLEQHSLPVEPTPQVPAFDLGKQPVEIRNGFSTHLLPPFGKPFVDVKKLTRLVILLLLLGIIIILLLLANILL